MAAVGRGALMILGSRRVVSLQAALNAKAVPAPIRNDLVSSEENELVRLGKVVIAVCQVQVFWRFGPQF